MDYDTLVKQAAALGEEEAWMFSLFSNVSALIMESLEDLNWAGFYIVRSGRLALGPFQGKVACIHIEKGRGVCGTAWAQDRTQRVEDVHSFPGHIACDSASNSEIVIPIHRDGQVIAVMDLDSPKLARFTERDQAGLEAVVKAIEQVIRT
ncbi:MAG: GAF domain-containing protein [Clostridiales bacterium]|nr:GAF domain-containing protein [Clostridiales bacterium]